MPQGVEPRHELNFMTELAVATLKSPAALCYFNPNGEVLLTQELLVDTLSFHRQHDLPPLDAWSNVRLFNIENGWLLMDSVGNWQLDIPDQEAAFRKGEFSPQDVDRFIRNASLYIHQKGMVIKNGDTMDGPGGIRWHGWQFENGISPPPRTVLRWVPLGSKDLPSTLLTDRSFGESHGAARAYKASVLGYNG